MIIVALQVDDASGFVECDAPEDVVEGRVGRHAGNDGAKGVQEVGAEPVDLEWRHWDSRYCSKIRFKR